MDLSPKPKQSDGSPFVSPCMFPSGVYLYITGCGDDEAVGDGDLLHLESEEAGDTPFVFGFVDWVLIAGGAAYATGAQPGDWMRFEVYCPATPVTPNPNNTGNCNIVNPPGIIVPAAGDGAYDLDLAQANPVLTPLHDGFWDWDFSPTGRGTVSVGAPQQAKAHLIPADYPLTCFVNKVALSDQALDFTIPAIEPKIMLPHWRAKVTLHNSGHTGLKVDWYVTTARVRTV